MTDFSYSNFRPAKKKQMFIINHTVSLKYLLKLVQCGPRLLAGTTLLPDNIVSSVLRIGEGPLLKIGLFGECAALEQLRPTE